MRRGCLVYRIVRRASEVFDGPKGATLAGVGARMGILFGTPLMGRISDTFSRSTALLIIGGGSAAIMMLLPLPGDRSELVGSTVPRQGNVE